MRSVTGNLRPDQAGLLLRRSNGAWTEPEVERYEDEAHLQRLLADEPGWIPGVSPEALTASELSLGAGYVDVCAVDLDGSITVVECKLASNSERRRMVVGQVIDYAASIWHGGPEAFLDAWLKCTTDDLAEYLSDEALAGLRNNINAARIDLCLAVDRIDADLRRLVEFLNRATGQSIRVTAIQLTYARDGDVEILMPSTFGGEIADAKSPDSQAAWTRDTFRSALRDTDRPVFDRLMALIDKEAARVGLADTCWYGDQPGGQIFPHPGGARYSPFTLWMRKSGELMIWGTWTNWHVLSGDSGFTELAAYLGQSLDSSKSVAASALDIEEFWQVALRCRDLINGDHKTEDGSLL